MKIGWPVRPTFRSLGADRCLLSVAAFVLSRRQSGQATELHMNKPCRTAIFATAIGCTVAALPASGHAMETAASIQYEFVAQPAGLSGEFAPADGAAVKFLALRTIDGVKLDASLWQPNGKSAADTTLIVMVHGSGGSYRQPPQSGLGRRLAAKGYASLALDTRQHDGAINTDNFFDIRRDIDAAVQTGRALGYRALVLEGHSLGNIQVQFYAATNWDRDIKAVILLGAFGNLPWKSRSILVQNEDDYKKLTDAAMNALRDGELDKVLPVKMHYFTGQDVPVTGKHVLTYRWDKSSVADGTYWIHRIPLPILLVRDEADGVVQPFEPHMLLAAAHGEGTLVPRIDFVLLRDPQPMGLRGHSFEGNEQPLADTVARWLADRRL
jgi:pimeloyl-ACP methyl ester carboxylesterase